VYDVILMQVLDSLQYLTRVVAEDFLFEGAETRENVGNGTAWNELHEDTDYHVLETRAKIPANGYHMSSMNRNMDLEEGRRSRQRVFEMSALRTICGAFKVHVSEL